MVGIVCVSGPAFNTGILYGNLDEAYELVSKWDKNKIINAYLEAPKKGFNTEFMGKRPITLVILAPWDF